MEDYLDLIKCTRRSYYNQKRPFDPPKGYFNSQTRNSTNPPGYQNRLNRYFANPTNESDKNPSIFSANQNKNESFPSRLGFDGELSFIKEAKSEFVPRSQIQSNKAFNSNEYAPPLTEAEYSKISQVTQRNIINPTINTDFSSTRPVKEKEKRRSRKFEFKRYSERKEKSYNWLFALLSLIFAISVVGIWLFSRISKTKLKIYCSSNLGGIEDSDNCEPCPKKGVCEGGVFLNCNPPHQIYQESCVEDKYKKFRFQQYILRIGEMLNVAKSTKFCNNSNLDSFSLTEIQEKLQEIFQDDFQEDIKNFNETWDIELQNSNANIIKVNERYTTNSSPPPFDTCQTELLQSQKYWLMMWYTCLIGIIVVAGFWILRLRKEKRLAEELYEDTYEYIRKWDKITVNQLKKEFQDRYTYQYFERIWKKVEKIRREKGEINSYVDHYQNSVQELWSVGHQ